MSGEPPFPDEQILVVRALIVGAKNMSSSMEKFIDWLLAGFAAGLTYILAQEKSSFTDFKAPVYFFLAAAVVGIAQRYVAMLVSMGAAIFEEAEKLHSPERPINIYRFYAIYLSVLPPLNRWAGKWVVGKFLKHDLTAFGRAFFRIATLQIFMGALCTILLFATFYQVLSRLK